MELGLTRACEGDNLAAGVATVAAVRGMPGQLFGAAGYWKERLQGDRCISLRPLSLQYMGLSLVPSAGPLHQHPGAPAVGLSLTLGPCLRQAGLRRPAVDGPVRSAWHRRAASRAGQVPVPAHRDTGAGLFRRPPLRHLPAADSCRRLRGPILAVLRRLSGQLPRPNAYGSAFVCLCAAH